jgi:hypothetical protein
LSTSTGESPYYLEIKKGYNKYMEEITQLPAHFGALTAAAMAAALLPLQLSLSLYSPAHTHVLSHTLSQNMPFL